MHPAAKRVDSLVGDIVFGSTGFRIGTVAESVDLVVDGGSVAKKKYIQVRKSSKVSK